MCVCTVACAKIGITFPFSPKIFLHDDDEDDATPFVFDDNGPYIKVQRIR